MWDKRPLAATGVAVDRPPATQGTWRIGGRGHRVPGRRWPGLRSLSGTTRLHLRVIGEMWAADGFVLPDHRGLGLFLQGRSHPGDESAGGGDLRTRMVLSEQLSGFLSIRGACLSRLAATNPRGPQSALAALDDPTSVHRSDHRVMGRHMLWSDLLDATCFGWAQLKQRMHNPGAHQRMYRGRLLFRHVPGRRLGEGLVVSEALGPPQRSVVGTL